MIRTSFSQFKTTVAVFLIAFFKVAMFAVFTGCSEDPSSVGSAFFPPNVKLDSLVVYADSTTTYRAPITGNSSRLLLGRYNSALVTIEARTLLQFNPSSTGINPDSVVSVNLRLVRNYWYYDTVGTLSFTIHKIISPWREDTITFAGSENLYTSNGSQAYTFTNPRDTIVVPIDTALINMWLRNPTENYGVILKPTAKSTVVYGFTVDLSNDIRPELIIRYHAQDTVRVDSVGTIQEAFVAYSPPLSSSSDTLLVQAGVADRGLLHFDVSSIPRSASITNAELQLVRIPSQSIRNQFSYDSVFVQYIVENSSPPKGSTSLLAQPVAEGDSVFKADITRFVQQWVTGAPNYGIAVRAYGEFIALDRFAFYGKADTLNRPTLRITYSLVQQQ